MKTFNLTVIILCFISGLAIANVPPPPPYNSKGIELSQDYPDFVFYFGKYYVFEEKGKSISKIDLEKIELTNLKPYPIKQPKDLNLQYFKERNINTDQVKFSVREDYLIAIKNEVHDQIKTKLSLKMIDLINQKKDGDGIYFAPVPEIGLNIKPQDIRYGMYQQRILVHKLDDNGLVFQTVRFQEGDNHYIEPTDEQKREKEWQDLRAVAILVGIILIPLLLVFGIGIFILRAIRKIK